MAGEKTAASAARADAPPDPAWPAELAATLGQVRQLLEAEQADQALEFLSQQKADSVWLTNAAGVCLLRLGQSQRALEVLRGLVLGGAGFSLRQDVPTRFKSNYATAQLLCGMHAACAVTLAQARDEADASVQRLRSGIRRWERSLPFWTRLGRAFGADGGAVTLDFPPGDL
jgi:hypothetical protein